MLLLLLVFFCCSCVSPPRFHSPLQMKTLSSFSSSSWLNLHLSSPVSWKTSSLEKPHHHLQTLRHLFWISFSFLFQGKMISFSLFSFQSSPTHASSLMNASISFLLAS